MASPGTKTAVDSSSLAPAKVALNTSTGELLTRSFFLLGALIFIGAAIAIWQINLMREEAQRLYEVEQPALAILRTHSDFQRFQAELQLASESRDVNQFVTTANSLHSAFDKDIERARRAIRLLPAGPERDKQASGLEAVSVSFGSQLESLTELATAGDWVAVQMRIQSRGPVIAELSEALVRDIDDLVAVEKRHELDQIQRAGSRALFTLVSIGIAILMIAGILGREVTRTIGGRLEQLDVAARALGRGEFQHRIQIGGRDEIARLARVFNEMCAQLSDLYGALRRSEAQFRSLIENASDFILVLDADGTVRYASPSFERAKGNDYSVVGQSVFDLVEGVSDRESLRDLVAGARRGAATTVAQFHVHRHDGARRVLEASATDLLDNPAVKAIVINARDVTERRQLEEQLVRSQRMEAIGTLSGGIAHDFNNLLTVILGHTEQLLDQTGNLPSLKGQLKRIDEAGRRAANLTRQLLAFSRKQVLQPKVFNMNSLILDLDKMLRRLIGENIELTTITDPHLGYVKADPSQIEQVVMNLVVNARDAVKAGGKVTIETANVDLDEKYAFEHAGEATGPHVMISVSDTGEGIPADVLPHIFEPFFTTKDVGQGTGLGLSMVYGIVKQSGGNIWVYSEPGRGTTFKTYFPMVHELPEVSKMPEAPSAVSGTETILVVEDEPALRELIQTVLRDNGFTVLAAPSPAEALSISRGHAKAIQLLLTDVVLPEMNGSEMAKELKRERPELKVLFMSGYASHFVMHQEALDAETRFLEKPFHPRMLLKRVREILDEG